jgi:hypothetical protein
VVRGVRCWRLNSLFFHLPKASDGRTGIMKSEKREIISMCDKESLQLLATTNLQTAIDNSDCQLERTLRRSLNQFTFVRGGIGWYAAIAFILTPCLVPILCVFPVLDFTIATYQ